MQYNGNSTFRSQHNGNSTILFLNKPISQVKSKLNMQYNGNSTIQHTEIYYNTTNPQHHLHDSPHATMLLAPLNPPDTKLNDPWSLGPSHTKHANETNPSTSLSSPCLL